MVDFTPPTEMDEEEIQNRYKNIWHNAVGNYKTDAEASLLAIEMNRRFVENSAKENEKLALENHNLSIQNHKLTKISIGISFLALFFAFTSAVFSYIDWRGDYSWQKQQLGLLEAIQRSSTEAQNSKRPVEKSNTDNNDKNTHN